MKVRLLLLAFATLMIAMTTNVFSQVDEAEADPLTPGVTKSAIYLGPVFGYNRSLHTADLASFADDPLCPFFQNGTANGFYVGLSYEHHIGNIKNSRHSVIGRVLYNSMPASFTKEGDVYPSLVDIQGRDTTVYSSTKHSIDVAYSMITAEVMYKFIVIPGMGLGLTIGPTFDFPMTKTLNQKYQLIEPLNFQFKRVENWEQLGYKYEDFDRTIIVQDGDIDEASGFRMAIKLGVQYELYFKKFYVVPAIYYNFALTKVTSAEDWKVNALQIGVDVRFAL